MVALPMMCGAGTVLDVDFNMWEAKIGHPDGADDGDRVQDASGNNYHGFWGGGGAANNSSIIAAPGGTGVDSSDTDGYVILRDGLTIDESWWTGTTPTPYFTLDVANNSYTFETMLNWEGSGTNGIDGLMGQIGTNEWWIRENAGHLEYVFDDGPDRVGQFGTAPIDITGLTTDSHWHHIAVVLDTDLNQVRTYVDYIAVHINTSVAIADLDTVGSGTADIRLGAYNNTASARFDGQQALYRISDEALTPAGFVRYAPTIKTRAASGVDATSADFNGDLTYASGEPTTGEKGHVSTINILLSKLFKARVTQGAVPPIDGPTIVTGKSFSLAVEFLVTAFACQRLVFTHSRLATPGP